MLQCIQWQSLFKKADAAADPILVFVVFHADHFAFAEAGEVVDDAGAVGALFPEHEHADFALGGYVGRLDDGGVGDFALEDEVFGIADAVEVVAVEVDDDAGAGEGVERLEDVVVQIVGDVVQLVEVVGFGDVFDVREQGQGVFADAKKPVRMAGPFDIVALGKIKFPLQIIPLQQFIENHPVEDFFDLHFLALLVEVKHISTIHFEVGNTEIVDAEHGFTRQKVDKCRLLFRLDFQQYNILRVVVANDSLTKELEVLVATQASEKMREFFGYGKVLAVHIRYQMLVKIQAGKALRFDETGHQAAIVCFANAKIHLQESSVFSFVGNGLAVEHRTL